MFLYRIPVLLKFVQQLVHIYFHQQSRGSHLLAQNPSYLPVGIYVDSTTIYTHIHNNGASFIDFSSSIDIGNLNAKVSQPSQKVIF